nr:MAG TPA: hypothetical protein [Caudoviricetes sp.]
MTILELVVRCTLQLEKNKREKSGKKRHSLRA